MSEQSSGFGREIRLPSPQQPKRLKITKTQVILGIAALVVLAIAAWAIVASILPTQGMKESDFVTECHESIKRQLKDPESAQIEEPLFGVHAEKSDDGDDKFSMSGIARARNGFGGMATFTYECTGGYSQTADRVFANARLDQ